MSKVYFISDLHLGHSGSLDWARDYRQGDTVEEMNQWMIDSINSVVGKRDTLWILGDICFRMEDMHYLNQIQAGYKRLVLGNHDTFQLPVYTKYFDKVYSYVKYKGFWISHMPIHEYDMVNCRVKGNIHGHLHQSKIDDTRYFNVSVEQCHSVPFDFDYIRRKLCPQ